MTKIVFVSDFFVDEVRGGAELCNEALIGLLSERYSVEKIKSAHITPQFILSNQGAFFIVANFFMLAEGFKRLLKDRIKYVILEHDHKYVRSNNPSLYKDFLAPETQLINKTFYKSAIAVMCQSKKHASVVQKNLLLNNIVSLSGNIWTEEQLQVLEKNLDTPKTIKHALLDSNNKNKGMPAAIDFCNSRNINYELLHAQPFESFITNLAQVENLVFFPQWLETYSRLAIEARILGCKLITNNLIGAASEEYFQLKGRELLEYIAANNTILMKKWFNVIEGDQPEYYGDATLPSVTIFCPIYNSRQYIEGFLEDMSQQTIFNSCELIIINANSPDAEFENKVIEEFSKTHSNVKYRVLDYRATVMETENMALKMARGEFFAQACVDDRHSPHYLETLSKHLYHSTGIDLVYADCYQTTVSNETFENNSSNGNFYEHSRNKFSKENMIKCLPGPMPMWRRTIHQKVGYFNEDLAHAGDWDMFLRMVDSGYKFKKVDVPLGLYYYNTDGLSTSKEYAGMRTGEEASVFFTYKHVFGEKNYNKYESYFRQFLKGNENGTEKVSSHAI
jgi:glycosyltransferase involved in cell wall biosynthesis